MADQKLADIKKLSNQVASKLIGQSLTKFRHLKYKNQNFYPDFFLKLLITLLITYIDFGLNPVWLLGFIVLFLMLITKKFIFQYNILLVSAHEKAVF